MARRTSKTSARKLETAQRRAFVMRMRLGGATYEQIAQTAIQEFGADKLPANWDRVYAYKDLKRELDAMLAETRENLDEIRRVELERLDAMLRSIWPMVIGRPPRYSAAGNLIDAGTPPNLHAHDRAMRIMERRARYLGLDAATAGMILNVDLSRLDDEQLRRLAEGEDPFVVLATQGKG